MPTASKKIINSWAMYDWANSAYSLIITSAIFPAYYTAIAADKVHFAGRIFDRASLASYSVSLSFLISSSLSSDSLTFSMIAFSICLTKRLI